MTSHWSLGSGYVNLLAVRKQTRKCVHSPALVGCLALHAYSLFHSFNSNPVWGAFTPVSAAYANTHDTRP